jgi:hypothetical protein
VLSHAEIGLGDLLSVLCAFREERRPKPPRYLLCHLHGVEIGDVLGADVTVGIIPRRRWRREGSARGPLCSRFWHKTYSSQSAMTVGLR